MLFYEQVEQLHDPIKEWNREAEDPEPKSEAIAQGRPQGRKADSPLEAPPAEDHNEAEANAAPTVAETKVLAELQLEPARQEPRMMEQSETRPADADNHTTPSADAASDLTAVEQTNFTDAAHVDSPNNTHLLNVQSSTVPSVEIATTVIPTSATFLPPLPAEEAMKGNRQTTPAMRTAPPRKSQGIMSRGGQGIEKVSSMVAAN